MDKDKLAKMQAQVRTGGKGSARRKKKVVNRSVPLDDRKQDNRDRGGMVSLTGVQEVNFIRTDGSVFHFNDVRVMAALKQGMFTVRGHGELKEVSSKLPEVLNKMDPSTLDHMKRFTHSGNEDPSKVKPNKNQPGTSAKSTPNRK